MQLSVVEWRLVICSLFDAAQFHRSSSAIRRGSFARPGCDDRFQRGDNTRRSGGGGGHRAADRQRAVDEHAAGKFVVLRGGGAVTSFAHSGWDVAEDDISVGSLCDVCRRLGYVGSAGDSLALRRTKRARKSPSSKSRQRGMAIINWEMTSGGVKIAATTKAPTIT